MQTYHSNMARRHFPTRLLQLRGLRPFLSPKYDLRKHPNFKFTGEADKKNAFDLARLISTRLTVAPNDLFTVYAADEVDEDIEGGEDTAEYDGYDPNA